MLALSNVKMRLFLGVTLPAFTILLACGENDAKKSSLQDAQDQPQRLLFVVSGGNTSCKPDSNGITSPYGMGLYQPFTALRDELEAGGLRDVQFLLTCHLSTPTVYYISSDNPHVLQQTTIDGYYAEVRRMRSVFESEQTYLTGHSYGGWLVMKAAQTFNFNIDGLFTIDPISRQNCPLLLPFGGCLTAPTDITPAQRQEIAAKTSQWANFFQTTTSYLHSSEIPEANFNLFTPGSHHFNIDQDPLVWDQLAQHLRQKFGITPVDAM